MRNALLRYRVMAYVVGTLLVVLVCVGLPLKYGYGDDTVVLYQRPRIDTTGDPELAAYNAYLAELNAKALGQQVTGDR